MIEINLVPDIKQEFLHSQRLRAKVISVAIIACLAATGVVVALFMYMGTQAIRGALADGDIDTQYKKLTSGDNEDLSKVVTIQNQLTILSSLNNKKPISSRAFDLLSAINPKAPNSIKMSTITIDPIKNVLTVEGSADEGFNAADAFKKTILNTTVDYPSGSATKHVPLASAVTVSNTSFGEDSNGKKVLRFRLAFTYPKELMSNELANVTVTSPAGTIDVTDSHLGVPASLFAQPATDIKEAN